MVRRHVEAALDALPLEKLQDPKVQKAAFKGGSMIAWQLAKRHPVGRAALMARRGVKLAGAVNKMRSGSKVPK